jgi:PHD/YefM family antitoxin component YafN of YafNO toxin-antitoxin module
MSPIYSASSARANLYKPIDEIFISHQPVHITDKRHNAVLVSEEDWRSIQETLCLMSVPGPRESLLETRKTPADKCERNLDW